ncbi:MAG: BtrH N-terminal domain-containing protein [Bacteroidales bacterium]|nr:BtrH N-terminal domain-containing protein [Bacteroidales bacterium]
MKTNFEHRQAAHCENGVTSNLLRYYGIELSEPMVFGIGSGYFFSHMPFYKLNGMPVTSFRVWPGMIFKRVTKRLGIKVKRIKYRNTAQAMIDLDKLLDEGKPVGMLVGVFHLPYFPREYRFHFNAHNITAFGKEGDRYYISDPVMEHEEVLTAEELKKVRFAKGTYPPSGRMYYITGVPGKIDLKPAIVHGIRQTAKDMLTIPVPFFGIRGIRVLARNMRNWPVKLGDRSAALNLGQVIRMLEEIGTGGAGFRFIFAAFLEEAAVMLDQSILEDLSKEMTVVGDQWRDFAVHAARVFKNRDRGRTSYSMLADMLLSIADKEERVFKQLRNIHL